MLTSWIPEGKHFLTFEGQERTAAETSPAAVALFFAVFPRRAVLNVTLFSFCFAFFLLIVHFPGQRSDSTPAFTLGQMC